MCHGITPGGSLICPACEKRLPFISGRRCRKCGKPVSRAETLCRDCASVPHVFTQGIGVFLYDEVMRSTVSAFKYRGRREYGIPLGVLAARAAAPALRAWRPGAVVPVPVHAAKLRRRGYNQAEVLARSVAAEAGLPLLTKLLVRRKKTEALKNLDPEARRKSVTEAFGTAAGVRCPERVLLVDDIYTTGATADGCAAALRAAGADRVYVLALCIGGGYLTRY